MALRHYLFDQTIFLTNFLTELRMKIPFERGIEIISPRRASPPNRASSPPYGTGYYSAYSRRATNKTYISNKKC